MSIDWHQARISAAQLRASSNPETLNLGHAFEAMQAELYQAYCHLARERGEGPEAYAEKLREILGVSDG